MRQSPLFVLLLAASSVAAAQEPPARAFESATVRPRTGTSGEEVISGLTPERSNASNVALRSLVAYAYGVRDYQSSSSTHCVRPARTGR